MEFPPLSTDLDLDAYFKEIHKNKAKLNKKCSKTTVFLLLLLVFIGAILCLHFNPKPFEFTNKPKIGTSQGYLKAALKFHDWVNKSVNPCDDFFEHACGKYIANNPIPAHLRYYSEINRLREEAAKNMKLLMDSPEASTSSAINKMKTLYRACIKEDDYVLKAPYAALNAVNAFGSWPMLEGASDKKPSIFSLQKLLTVSKNHESLGDTGVLFNFVQERYPKDQKKRILTFEQTEHLLIDREHHLDHEKYKKERKAMKKLIVDRVTLFSNDHGFKINPQLEKDVEDIIAFEGELAKIMKSKDEARDRFKAYKLMNFNDFSAELKESMNFDLKEFALATFQPHLHGIINSDETELLITDLEFPKKLATVLKKFRPETIINYMMYNVFANFIGFFGKKYRDIDFETKASMNVLNANLKDSFTEMVQKNTWMNKETKIRATKKVKEMEVLVGYSDYAFDDAKLDDYYAKLEVSDSDDYISIREKLKRWSEEKKVEEFMKPLNRKQFYGTAATVNAFHLFDKNLMVFPGGFLQFPFFEKDQPQAMNYGLIGSIIGHEITHGFDDEGKKYDEKGDMNNWWSEETLKQYTEKAQCLVEQYGAVEVPTTDGMHINGKLTLGENIGDNGEIRESYRAFQKFLSKNGPEPLLPGIDVSPEQMFFYNYPMCSTERPAYLKFLLLNDNHTPMKYRTNLVMQNTPEFAKAFNCPLGSPMNPEKKCAVW